MTLQEVYDYLKTRCPNNIVRYGFHWEYCYNTHTINFYNMVENIKVSTMLGNLSHPVRDGHGSKQMFWPESFGATLLEEVTMDTLEEMGLKPNE